MIIMVLSVYFVVDCVEVDVSILCVCLFIYCIGCLEIIMNCFKIILEWLECFFFFCCGDVFYVDEVMWYDGYIVIYSIDLLDGDFN